MINNLKIGLKILLVVAIGIGAIKILFGKKVKRDIRIDFFDIPVNSKIADIYSFKDDLGSGRATHIEGYNVPFCIVGVNKDSTLFYNQIAETGDSIFKKSNSNLFTIKHNDTLFHFEIIECSNRK